MTRRPNSQSLPAQGRPAGRQVSGLAFALLLFHLVFEYLRLHDLWPILGALRVQTAFSAALAVAVVHQVATSKMRLPRQSWLLLAFLALASVTTPLATNWFYAYTFAYTLALTLIGYFGITHILQTERDVNSFLKVLVGIHVFLAVKVILGYQGAAFDEWGYLTTFSAGSHFLGDENDVALAMILILPFAGYLFLQKCSLLGRILWGAGTATILLSIIFTFSRGGFVGLTVLLLCWLVTSKRKWSAAIAMVVAVLILVSVAPPRYWERIGTIQATDEGTAKARREYWTAASRMFLASPIHGVGGNNFGVLVPRYALELSPDKRPTRWGMVAHSMYFQLLAEFGLLGLLLLGAVFVQNFRDLKRIVSDSRRARCPRSIGQLAEAVRLGFVGFLIPAAFLSVLGYPHLYYLTALAVVVRRLAYTQLGVRERQAIRRPPGTEMSQAGMALARNPQHRS